MRGALTAGPAALASGTFVLLLAGCGSPRPALPGGCSAYSFEQVPDEGRAHVPEGTAVTYRHNPPASGPHWPSPAPWGIYAAPVPRPEYVHDLEHGGVVLAYDCGTDSPRDCAALFDALTDLYARTPPDAAGEVKLVVTPDPALPAPVAAIAWDWDTLEARPDARALACFIALHRDQGPESVP